MSTIDKVSPTKKKLIDGAMRVLSEEGVAHAERLAELLERAGLAAIYVSQAKRTQETAAPVAAATGLEPRVIPAEQRSKLLRRLKWRHRGEVVLVVGHSNTLPDIVQALTGVAVPPIDEQEYDRVHVAILSPGTTARLVTFRYGAPSVPPMAE